MDYKKQKFANGQVLTAECLNRMEDGIKDACDAVPPACPTKDCSKVLSYGENGCEWVDVPNAVLFVEQALTEEQRKQARLNIDAPSYYELEDLRNDVLINNTDRIEVEEALSQRLKRVEDAFNADITEIAGIHNSYYRGKYLGDAVTDEQWRQINSGRFDDMYIGDYWEIGGIRYRIAAFNYYSGDAVNDHNDGEQQNHVTIVPDFMNAEGFPMHSSSTVAYGYVNSNMSKIYLEHYLETVLAAFGKGHLMCSHQYLTSAITGDGVASQGYFWRFIDLMNEQMVYGSRINGMTIFGEYNRVATVDKSQLPLFAFRPDLIVARNPNDANGLYPQGIRYQYWLRDAGSPRGFCAVSQNGLATVYTATTANCIVRPVFSIVAGNAKTVAARSTNATYEDYGLEV